MKIPACAAPAQSGIVLAGVTRTQIQPVPEKLNCYEPSVARRASAPEAGRGLAGHQTLL